MIVSTLVSFLVTLNYMAGVVQPKSAAVNETKYSAVMVVDIRIFIISPRFCLFSNDAAYVFTFCLCLDLLT